MPGSFDRLHQLALVFGAGAGDAFWNYFSLLCDETVQFFFILIIDVDLFRVAEAARAFFSNCIRVALFSPVVAASPILTLMEHSEFSFLSSIAVFEKQLSEFPTLRLVKRRHLQRRVQPQPPDFLGVRMRFLLLSALSCLIVSSNNG